MYKLKNYGNPTLRVESAPVAQCSVYYASMISDTTSSNGTRKAYSEQLRW